MPSDFAFYCVATAAVILVGLSKGGFSGLNSLAMPLLTLAISPVRAAAILLPILIAQDWVGVWAFRHEFDRRNLLILIPSALIGVFVGWALAAYVSEAVVRLAVGLISIAFVAFMSLPKSQGSSEFSRPKIIPGLLWGSIAGFTSMVSHSGGPPFLVYVMPQRLSPPVLAGTGTLFFAAVNLLKAPVYFALGQFTTANLLTSAVMLPIAILSTLAGVWLVRKVSVDAFYGLILALTLLVGLKLTYDAAVELMT